MNNMSVLLRASSNRVRIASIVALLETKRYEEAEHCLSTTDVSAALSHASLLYLRIRLACSKGRGKVHSSLFWLTKKLNRCQSGSHTVS